MKQIATLEDINNCYVLFGEENWLKEQFMTSIIKTLGVEKDLMNYSVIEGKDFKVKDLIDACETMPFFVNKRLVVVNDSGFFKAGKKEETQQVLKWIKDLPGSTILVFSEKELDKRNAFYKWMNTNGAAIEFQFPEENETISIVEQIAKEKEIVISRPTVRYFINNMPKSINHMIVELEKLSAYCQKEEVTVEAIRNVCNFALEQHVFELLKQITNKDAKRALGIYHQLMERKESPVGVLVLIGRQYRMLIQGKYLIKNNISQQQLAKKLGIPMFVAKEMMLETKKYSFKQLEEIIEKCLHCDVAIKTGQMEPIKGVELLILECMYI
ncbi:MAG: DNA polymerase III subunit delta [Cellulosilyticaceae bacterium]